MKRIVLLQPQPIESKRIGLLGLAYLSAYLKQEGHDVKILDVNVNATQDTIIDDIISFRPEYVGSTIWAFNYQSSCTVIKRLRESLNATYIIGGPSVTLRPSRALTETGADIAILGDGIPTINHAISGNFSARGVARLRNGKLIHNGVAEYNLNSWPVPDLYYHRDKREVGLVTSVGCWWSKCSFCILNDLSVKLRFADTKRVVATMNKICMDRNFDVFFFYDDNFLNSNKRLVEIVEGMISSGIRQKIAFESRADDIVRSKNEIYQTRKKIARIDIGAEAFSDNKLKKWNKGVKSSCNRDAFDTILSYGIEPVLYLMIVDDDTNLQEIENVCELFKKNPLHLLFARINVYKDFSENRRVIKYKDYILFFAKLLDQFANDTRLDMFKRSRNNIVKKRGEYDPGLTVAVEKYLNNVLKLLLKVKSGNLTPKEATYHGRKINFELHISLLRLK